MARILSMPIQRAMKAAQAVLPHTSNDAITPVLTLAVVRDGHLIATDRYSVGRFRLDHGLVLREEEKPHGEVRMEGTIEQDYDPTWEHPFRIPRAALQRVATLSKAHTTDGIKAETRVAFREVYGPPVEKPSATDPLANREHFIVVEVLNGSGDVEFSQRFRSSKSNYPPVEKLLEQWEAAEGARALSFFGTNLEKVTKFAGKYEPIMIQPGKPAAHQSADAPGPVKVTVGDDFVALIMPTTTPR